MILTIPRSLLATDMRIPRDKQLHLIAGFGIGSLALLHPFLWTAVPLAAVVKELRDLRGHGTPEVWDAVATIAGGLPWLIIFII